MLHIWKLSRQERLPPFPKGRRGGHQSERRYRTPVPPLGCRAQDGGSPSSSPPASRTALLGPLGPPTPSVQARPREEGKVQWRAHPARPPDAALPGRSLLREVGPRRLWGGRVSSGAGAPPGAAPPRTPPGAERQAPNAEGGAAGPQPGARVDEYLAAS